MSPTPSANNVSVTALPSPTTRARTTFASPAAGPQPTVDAATPVDPNTHIAKANTRRMTASRERPRAGVNQKTPPAAMRELSVGATGESLKTDFKINHAVFVNPRQAGLIGDLELPRAKVLSR